MAGDYTRLTFRPERGYSSVRLQQGRVQVDADWNEAADIGLYLDRTSTRDVVGRTGVPEEAPGFALTPADPDGAGTATDLLLGFGRAYVDGIIVENLAPAPTVLGAVAGSPGAFLVQSGPVPRLDQWLIDAADPSAAPVRVTARPAPVEADGGLTRVTLSPVPAGAAATLTIVPSLLAQPDLTGDPVPAAEGLYGVYLEVFERDITALDDPLLREIALGGPDTCLRTQVVWQTRADDSGASCKDYPPGWSPDTTPRAQLAAQGVPAIAADDPCLTPDPGGYRGIDNRLFRVEVHRGGDLEANQVLVKWSRDNGIHRTRYTLVADRLRVESLGRDDATALDHDQWVEVQDEAAWGAGVPGHMVRLGEVNGLEIAVAEVRDPVTNLPLTDADGDPQVAALPPAGLLRRWEGGPPVPVAADTPLALEAGIQVTFGAGRLSPGDRWTIPARTLTAAVEWPRDPATGAPLAIPAQAVARHYMALGIVRRTGEGRLEVVSDCRRIFPPLSALTTFEMLGGDGQEAMPDLRPGSEATLVPLAAPLRVGVSRGLVPVAGRLVQFTTADANPGRLDPVPGTPGERILRALPTDLIIATAADGVADAQFSIHGRRTAYAVEARLLDADEPDRADPVHLPIRFFAAAEVAVEVAYDPRACRDLLDAGVRTVQQAIDALCQRPSGSGSCCVTVGDRGEFPTLDIAIAELVEAGERDLCLCLLAGDHQLASALQRQDHEVRIAIHGCGAEVTRLHLVDRRAQLAAEAIAIGDLSIEIETQEGGLGLAAEVLELSGLVVDGPPQGTPQPFLRLNGSRELRLTDSRIVAPSAERIEPLITNLSPLSAVIADALQPAPRTESRERARAAAREIEALSAGRRQTLSARISTLSQQDGLRPAERLAIGELARAVGAGSLILAAIERLRLAAAAAQPGPALVIGAMRANIRIERNEIRGTLTVSMSGEPEEGLFDSVDWHALVERARQGGLVVPGPATLRLERNRLGSFTVDVTTMSQLRELASGGGAPLTEVFASAIVSGNVFTGRPLVVLAERHACDHNRFEIDEDAGALVGQTATCLGNWANNDFRLFAATQTIVPQNDRLRFDLNAMLNIVHG